MGTEQCAVVFSSVVSLVFSNLKLFEGGLASSAWHIDQMGQPPRLGCLGMCTGQCAVVDVNSKCWRNMLEPGWALEARRKASEARRSELEGA